MGFVGLCLSAHMSKFHTRIFGTDKEKKVIKNLNNNIIHLQEPNLELILIDNKHKRILAFDELNNYIQIFDI